MRISAVSGILALAGSSVALSDSSPWVLLSTSPFDVAPSSSQTQTAPEVLKYTKEYLMSCPTTRYLVVTQPGANAADLSRSNGCAMPHLCRAFDDPLLRAKYTVAEVVGEVRNPGVSNYIKSACAQKNKVVSIDEVSLASLSAEDRATELADNDRILGQSLEAAADSDSYTILFFSTPAEPTYEPEFFDSLHTDLKRHMQGAFAKRKDNETDWDSLPLFQKYQFFTPGIFMAIVTAVILLSILGVGLRALASLEVSYGAFEKDMGPAAQKKQQ